MVVTALLEAPLGETGRVVGALVALGLAMVATNAWVCWVALSRWLTGLG